ncbi:MAG: phosphoribosylformylglycinamidine synthase [bacterium]|nr:phosphoribosylformylglycinamidine synthase [bacterium]
MKVKRLYVPVDGMELCYNIGLTGDLSLDQELLLRWLLMDIPGRKVFNESQLKDCVAEVGPRLSSATPFSSNAVSILQGCGLSQIERLEMSRRYIVPEGQDWAEFVRPLFDRMTQQVYEHPLETFDVTGEPEPVYTVPVLTEGREALRRESKKMGFGWDEQDIDFAYDLFVNQEKRDPTNVELFQLAQANSEHSRHWLFKAKIVIDGEEMPETLLDLVMKPWKINPGNSVIAFNDNSSAIWGFAGLTDVVPTQPWRASFYQVAKFCFHALFTAETHNFPTGIAPFPGAETGTGGRIRDSEATGRGSTAIVGTAGYCAAHLLIPGYRLPWETAGQQYPNNMASALQIIIQASDGASDYGNKFGEPVIAGFSHSVEIALDDGTRWAFIKPIMFTGGVGRIMDGHLIKNEPVHGMKVVQVGGPAYRIGFGGGAASSQIQGDNKADLDFNAVQRGDAEMEQKVRRVFLACINLGIHNPTMSNIICSLHDQGAGGPCNVVTEIVHPAGARLEIRKINLGDKTLPVIAIWGAEYQERYALLVMAEHLDLLQLICEREHVNCEVLGDITGDGRIVLRDAKDNTTPVNLGLAEIMGKLPQKTFRDTRQPANLKPLRLPRNTTVLSALNRVLRLLSVGSKEHYTNKVDRSVTGLVARQQCCGARQLPVSDVAVTAFTHFNFEGIATSIGERTLAMLVDPAAGARLAVAEALTNLVWADGVDLKGIRASVNWMWPAKLQGELAAMYDAMQALSDFMTALGMAADGGKDSVSMATRVGDQIVKSPRELVISAYATIPDVRRVVTPDIKRPGKSSFIYLDLGGRKMRMGGSALAYVYRQLGNECPDIDAGLLSRAFQTLQLLTGQNLILSGHDKGDGGLIVTLLEMVFAGGCGLEIDLPIPVNSGYLMQCLFNEEPGMVIEADNKEVKRILGLLRNCEIPSYVIGRPTANSQFRIWDDNSVVVKADMDDLLADWRDTSYHFRLLQTNPKTARAERRNTRRFWHGHDKLYQVVKSELPMLAIDAPRHISVAVIREEGTNGDKEMVAALHLAGFCVAEVTMSDLLTGRVNIDNLDGVIFPGGFSYADTLGAGKGWAGKILFSPKLKEMFERFYLRPDTFSFGVCNGCQLMAQLGWVPTYGLPYEQQPVFTNNESGKFESRWSTVTIRPSPAIMLQGMEGQTMGIWVAHGEGQLYFPDKRIRAMVAQKHLAPIRFVDDDGLITERYPFNPNGSPGGITALCSEDGRHLAMMPHPERCFLMWQWPWVPPEMRGFKISPWLGMFQNAYRWCVENRAK